MGTSHLILGETTDYITGRTITDTHDERARQTLAKLLVDSKGFSKNDIQVRRPLTLDLDKKAGTIQVDFTISVNGKACMIIIYGPGSLVTRQRPTLAIARIIETYIVSYAVITNGRDAITMDARSGGIIAEGLDEIPSKTMISQQLNHIVFDKISSKQQEKEKRILFAMEILTQQECDEYTCRLY